MVFIGHFPTFITKLAPISPWFLSLFRFANARTFLVRPATSPRSQHMPTKLLPIFPPFLVPPGTTNKRLALPPQPLTTSFPRRGLWDELVSILLLKFPLFSEPQLTEEFCFYVPYFLPLINAEVSHFDPFPPFLTSWRPCAHRPSPPDAHVSSPCKAVWAPTPFFRTCLYFSLFP